MGRKTALILVTAMLSYKINIFADTTPFGVERGRGGERLETITATFSSASKTEKEKNNRNATPATASRAERADFIYNVSFPANTKAYLDPDNLSGRGQIFSERYPVENYGNMDVAIKIKAMTISRNSTEDTYEFTEEEITDHDSGIKKMNICMVWKNENRRTEKTLQISDGETDEYVIVLDAAEYDGKGAFAEIDEKSTGYFYFTGTLNSNPEVEWTDGELNVRFDYEIMAVDQKENLDWMKGLGDDGL